MSKNRTVFMAVALVILLLRVLCGCPAPIGPEEEDPPDGDVVTCTVTYNGNGNTGVGVPGDSTEYETGDTVTVLGNTGELVRDNCTFVDWNTDPDGTGDPRAPGSTFVMGSADVILYAQWEENAEPVFVSLWNTENVSDGSSESNQLMLPLESDGTYDFILDWGDGSEDEITSWDDPAVTHTYDAQGVYEVCVRGTISGFRFADSGDKEKIIQISEFGPLNLGNNAAYFHGAANLTITATDQLDLSGTTDLSYAFADCGVLSDAPSMESWDVGNVTDMSYMFLEAWKFEQDLASWNVGRVENMLGMFYGSSVFNRSLASWDVSSVTDMSYMFYWASAFNQDLTSWDVSSVINMSYMFYWPAAFNGSLASWDVSSVTDMSHMFRQATAFNQDLGSWDVRNVTDMSYMFESSDLGATNYSGILIGWAALEDPSVQPDVAFSAGDAEFRSYAALARQDLVDRGWLITDGGQAEPAFVSLWNTENVSDGSSENNQLMLPLESDGDYEFTVAWGDDSEDEISSWDNSAVLHTYENPGVYEVCVQGTITGFNFEGSGDKEKIIEIREFGPLNLGNNAGYFSGASNLTIPATDPLDLTGTTDLSGAFGWCAALTTAPSMTSWDTSGVSNMEGIFYDASFFDGELGSWDVHNVTDMSFMFYGATDFNQDLGSWDVHSVTDMSFMFCGTQFSQDLGSWDVRNVTDMSKMFTYGHLDMVDYDGILIGWAGLKDPPVQQSVEFSAGGAYYFTSDAVAARAFLVDDRNWSITDGGEL
jgi:surface protein